jgi:hypothetical protein
MFVFQPGKFGSARPLNVSPRVFGLLRRESRCFEFDGVGELAPLGKPDIAYLFLQMKS